MGAESRTRLALFGLLTVALFDFLDVFSDGSFVGPALLGMAVAMAITTVGRRLGVSPLLTLLAALLLVIVYAGLIFEPSSTFFGLPTLDSIRAMIEGARSAYSHSSIDFAPVVVRPGYALMITVGFWAAASIGEVGTFRWRRPLIAAIPAVALFAVGLVVGTGKTSAFWVALFLVVLLTFLAAEATYSARFWGRWVTAWSDHSSPEGQSASAPLARRMAAVCVGGALIAPALVPGLGAGLLHWRNRTGHGPGGSGGSGGSAAAGGPVDPLVSIVPHLIHQSDSVLFSVRTKDPEYLRLMTLTNFDGTNWTASDQRENPVGPSGSIPASPQLPASPKVVQETVTINGLTGDSVPSVEGTQQATLGNGAAGRSLVSMAETGDLRINGGLDNGVNYQTSSSVPDITSFSQVESAEVGDAGDPQLVSLPHPLSQAVTALRNKWIEGTKTPMQRLVAIQAHLRRFTYEITTHTRPTQDYLSQFLLVTRTGYCQQFATAFALLARSLHYPARVVVGFLPGRPTADGDYQIRGTDAHAWPEVYFSDFGWVRFEPTPRNDSGGSTDPPTYTGPQGGTTASASTPSAQGGNGKGSNPRQVRGRENFHMKGGSLNTGSAGTLPSLWYGTFKRLAAILAVSLLLVLLSVPAVRWTIVRRRYLRARNESDTARAAFAQFEDRSACLALPRRGSESASAFATRVAIARSLPMGVARRLASIYEAAEYSETGVTRPDATEAKSLARRLDSLLWSYATLIDRVSLLFSPRAILQRARQAAT